EGVAADGPAGCGVLPLRLRGQTSATPAGVGIGVVVAHVHDRRVRVERYGAPERVRLPAAVDTFPIERRAPVALAPGSPAVREPQIRPATAAGRAEPQIRERGHQ